MTRLSHNFELEARGQLQTPGAGSPVWLLSCGAHHHPIDAVNEVNLTDWLNYSSYWAVPGTRPLTLQRRGLLGHLWKEGAGQEPWPPGRLLAPAPGVLVSPGLAACPAAHIVGQAVRPPLESSSCSRAPQLPGTGEAGGIGPAQGRRQVWNL